MCLKDLKEMNIIHTLEEIRLMSKNKFTQILRNKTKTRALNYLTEKQGSKGKCIKYSQIEMSEYLLPNNLNLSIDEKINLFALRNKMINVPSNFQKSEEFVECLCGEKETMEHIYHCESFKIENNRLPYQKLYCGTLSEQTEVFWTMMKNLENRDKLVKIRNEIPCDPNGSAAICSIG
jgi:hypothetical protein